MLCPGKAYDRSPCGTGTSAKLACLAADGKLAEGAEWVQESLIGSVFRGKYRRGATSHSDDHGLGLGERRSTLILDEHDPYCWGIA